MSAPTMERTCPDWCTADHDRLVSEVIESNRQDVLRDPSIADQFARVLEEDIASVMKWHELLVHHSDPCTVQIECGSDGAMVINTVLGTGREFDLDEKSARTLAAALIVAADRFRQIAEGQS